MNSMSEVLSKLPVAGRWNSRYSRNQSAMFPPLTRVNRAHHQARGFDRARRCIRAAPLVIELTPNRYNSVTKRDRSREICVLVLWASSALRIQLLCPSPEQLSRREGRIRSAYEPGHVADRT